MAMSYTSLTGARGNSGSIANWVNYTLLDLPPLVDEAQLLLYTILRVREMRTTAIFTIPQGNSSIALAAIVPADGSTFLDPISRIRCSSLNLSLPHMPEGVLQGARLYSETTGSFGTNPFTTTGGSSSVSVNLANHGFNQGGSIYITGATTVDPTLTPNGTFDITGIIDPNNFTIDCSTIGTATGSVTGGGSAAAYTCDNLIQNSPRIWSIIDERVKFDCAFNQGSLCTLAYFRGLPLLSATNQTNFLTTRYPQLMRKACMCSAADFMKDDTEYQKQLSMLQIMVERVQVQDDLLYRGADITMDTPGDAAGGYQGW